MSFRHAWSGAQVNGSIMHISRDEPVASAEDRRWIPDLLPIEQRKRVTICLRRCRDATLTLRRVLPVA
jgi:hypothetical protein